MSETIGKFVADNIFSWVASIFGIVILYYLKILVKNAKASKRHKLLSTDDLDLYGEIVERLTRTLLESKADRCYILSIRNGDVQINNLHQHKLYCDYEVGKDGVMEMKKHIQGIAVQDVYDLVMMYYKNTRIQGVSIIQNGMYGYQVDGLDDGYVKTLYKTLGTEISYQMVMRDSCGDLMGIVGLDYTKGNYPDKDSIQESLLVCKERIECIIKGRDADKH